MTRTEYICVPPNENEDPQELSENGYEYSLDLISRGWRVWLRTTTWEEIIRE